jgi:acyl-CoA hydrolase
MTPAEAVEVLAVRLEGRGGRVWVPGAAAEPLALAAAWRERPDTAAGLTFVGAWTPGVNVTDWAGLHPTARAETTFAGGPWRASLAEGRTRLVPLAYSQTLRWLQRTPLDVLILHVSPPDAEGRCSFGVAADFAPLLLDRPGLKVGLINPAMPRVANGPTVDVAGFDLRVEAEHPLPTYDPGATGPLYDRIAAQVLEVTPEGATVEIGLGKAGAAVLAALRDRRGLKLHTGMVADGLLHLLDAGAVDHAVTALALGSEALYARAAADARVRFASVDVTHDLGVMAAIPRFTAVNSALEVDLFGQANAEFANGRAVSGLGGLPDFLRGAALSEGGVPIIALPSTGPGGSSRIVARLEVQAVSIPRNDVGVVVTEHGIADLRGLSEDARADALIGVAAPEHRDELAEAWRASQRTRR